MPRKRTYVRVGVSLREEDLKEADRLAQEMGLARSTLIRLALLEFLKRHQPPDPPKP